MYIIKISLTDILDCNNYTDNYHFLLDMANFDARCTFNFKSADVYIVIDLLAIFYLKDN